MTPWKQWLRHPGYSLTSLATLTLALGANLVVFTFVNALWLRPPPVTDPERVALIGRDFSVSDPSRYSELGLKTLLESQVFSGIAGQAVTSGDFSSAAPPIVLTAVGRPVETAWITADFFTVLGVSVRGREFTNGDGDTGVPAPAIISDRLWREALDGRPDVLGLVVHARPVDLQVVGVAAPDFSGARRGERTDLWLPHHLLPRLNGENVDNLRHLTSPLIAIARLRPGLSLEGARIALSASMAPHSTPAITTLAGVFGTADASMVVIRGDGLMTLAGVASVVVLAGGCATLLAITLVHYERRRRELSIRAALGASRRRLVAQVALELSSLALVGMGCALWLSRQVIHLLPRFSLPSGVDLSRLDLVLDWRVAAVAVSCCIVAFAIAGALPALRFTRPWLAAELVSANATPSRSSLTLRRCILATHVGATTAVLIAAVLFVRSVLGALAAGPGFDVAHVAFATVQTRYSFVSLDDATLAARKARDISAALVAVEQIKQIPGVESVALGPSPIDQRIEDRIDWLRPLRTNTGEQDAAFSWLTVDRDYLSALGAPLLAGRAPTEGEAVVTPSFAAAFFDGESPIGQSVSGFTSAMTIVGVADLTMGSMRLGHRPGLVSVGSSAIATSINRTQGELPLTIRARSPSAIVGRVKQLLTQAFPEAPRIRVVTAEDVISSDLGRERMGAWLFSGFGLVALAIAVLSVAGLVGYLIESRAREFAVRVALGATRADIVGRALWSSLEPAIVGAAAGLVGALAVGRLVESYLFGLSGADPLTYATVFVTLIGCVAITGALATRRVRRLPVVESLRSE